MKKLPLIGSLDRQITIQSFTVSKNSFGEDTRAWSAVASNIWAKVEEVNRIDGQEKEEIGRETAISKTKFTIRYRSGITKMMRILYGSDYYNIVSVNEVGRRVFLELMADHRDNGSND